MPRPSTISTAMRRPSPVCSRPPHIKQTDRCCTSIWKVSNVEFPARPPAIITVKAHRLPIGKKPLIHSFAGIAPAPIKCFSNSSNARIPRLPPLPDPRTNFVDQFDLDKNPGVVKTPVPWSGFYITCRSPAFLDRKIARLPFIKPMPLRFLIGVVEDQFVDFSTT